jgi:WD40 repeat protein
MADPLSPTTPIMPLAKPAWPKLPFFAVLVAWLVASALIFWVIPVQPRFAIPTSIDFYLAGFSADGKTLVTTFRREASDVGPIHLWDIRTGQYLGIVRKEGCNILPNVVYHPQGNLLDETAFAYYEDSSVVRGKPFVLYDLIARHETGAIRLKFDPDASHILCFAPDGQTLALVRNEEENGCLRLFDVASGRERFNLQGGAYGGLKFSPDSKTLAIIETKTNPDENQPNDEKLILLDTASGKRQMMLEGYGGMILAFDWSPEGKRLAMFCRVGNLKKGDTNGELKFWDTATGQEVRLFKGQGPAVFLPDGNGLAILDEENESVRFCHVMTGKEFAKVRISPAPLTRGFGAFVPIPGTHFLAVIHNRHSESNLLLQWWANLFGIKGLDQERDDEEVTFLDTSTGKKVGMIVQKRMPDIQVSPDGKTLALRSIDGDSETIQVWDIPPRKPIQWVIGLLAIPTVATLIVIWKLWGRRAFVLRN